MKLEKQVCSLKLSKKLKELRVKQDSIWYRTNGVYGEHVGWSNVTSYKWDESKKRLITKSRNTKHFHLNLGCPQDQDRYGSPDPEHIKWYSAFTVAELGEMLPHGFSSYSLETITGGVNWYCENYIKWASKFPVFETKEDDTEANARAKMLIWLIENKHLNIKEL